MKIFIILLAFIVLIRTNIYSQNISTDPNYILVFEDNFNFLDLNKWSVADGYSYHDKLALKSSYVSVSNGVLILKADNTPYLGYPYTGSQVKSNEMFNPGIYVECRSKIPSGAAACWPAFWMQNGMHNNGGTSPNCGCVDYNEIDFMEWFDGMNRSSKNFHWCPTNGGCVFDTDNLYEIPNVYSYHIYGGYWNQIKTSFLLDGTIHYSENTKSIKPMNIINDLYIHSWSIGNGRINNFPLFYEIDYIRAYRIKRNCNTVINEILNFNNYLYSLKKSITLSGLTIFPSNSYVSLYAIDYIEFKDGLTLNSSSNDIVFNINECY